MGRTVKGDGEKVLKKGSGATVVIRAYGVLGAWVSNTPVGVLV